MKKEKRKKKKIFVAILGTLILIDSISVVSTIAKYIKYCKNDIILK